MPLPPHLADFESRIRSRFDAAFDDLRRQYEDRLRQAHEGLLTAVAALEPPAEPLAGLELPDLERVPRRLGREEAFAALLGAARDIDRTTTQAAALSSLLAAATSFAERAGLLLARADALRGWGSAGFVGDPFAGSDLAWSEPALATLGDCRGAVELDATAIGALGERLGFAGAPAAAVMIPLVLRDRTAALLYADGERVETAALQLLVATAARQIELQALSDRGWTPSLYAAGEAPGAGLPRWDSAPAGVAAPALATLTAAPEPAGEVAAEPLAPPTVVTPPVEPPARFTFEDFAQPAPPLEPAPEPIVEPAVESFVEPPPPAGEPVFEMEAEPEVLELAPEPVAETAGAEPFPWEAAVPAEVEDSGFELEAVPEEAPVEPEPLPFEPPAFEPPAFEPAPEPPPADATVRIPVYRPEAAPAEPLPPAFDERTAPLASELSGTREVPQLTPPPAAPVWPAPAGEPAEEPAAMEEDATLLMTRRVPVQPVEPPPVVAPPPAEPEEDTQDRTAARAGRSTEVAPPPDLQGPGLAFAAARTARSSGENALHEEARRLARLLVSEIKLYNEENVLEGRRNRDLYARLREDIDRSRQIYEERVHESVRQGTDYFQQELVRSLAGGDARALGM